MLDLSKIVYRPLEDGDYTIVPQTWDLKQGKDSSYVSVKAELKGLNGRQVTINLFEKGLNITAVNVIEFLELPETSLADVLDQMLRKELPAYHQTVHVDGNTYYNWYICNKPAMLEQDGEDAVPAF